MKKTCLLTATVWNKRDWGDFCGIRAMAAKQGAAARASPRGDHTPARSCPGRPHGEDIPWGDMCRQEGHRHPSWSVTGRTEPVALESVSIWDTVYSVSTCNPWASLELAFSISYVWFFFFSSILLHNYTKKRKTSYKNLKILRQLLDALCSMSLSSFPDPNLPPFLFCFKWTCHFTIWIQLELLFLLNKLYLCADCSRLWKKKKKREKKTHKKQNPHFLLVTVPKHRSEIQKEVLVNGL